MTSKGARGANDVELHPIVAALAGAIQRSPDKSLVAIPPDIVDKARAQVRANDDPELIPHLIALAVKTRRVAGDGGIPVIAALALLVAEKLGSHDDVADRFAAAGIADAKALLGTVTTSRAPRDEKKPAALTVKAKRGLS